MAQSFRATGRSSTFRDALGHSLTLPSIQNSLKYASLATLVDVVLGIAIAYVVVRTKLPGREVLDAIAMLPLAVPGIVLAFGYLAMTQERKHVRALNPIKDPLPILVIAYSVRRLPMSSVPPRRDFSKQVSPSRKLRKTSAAHRSER